METHVGDADRYFLAAALRFANEQVYEQYSYIFALRTLSGSDI